MATTGDDPDGICGGSEPRIVERADGAWLTRSGLTVARAVELVERHGSPAAAAGAEPALDREDAELALALAERRPEVAG
jgi:hypothetical protein